MNQNLEELDDAIREGRYERDRVGKSTAHQWECDARAALTRVSELHAAAVVLGPWISAAMSDSNTCAEFRDAAERFLDALEKIGIDE